MSSFVYQHTRKRHLPAPHFPKRLASLPTAPGAYAVTTVTTLASHYMNMTALNAILTHKLEGLPDKHVYLLDG